MLRSNGPLFFPVAYLVGLRGYQIDEFCCIYARGKKEHIRNFLFNLWGMLETATSTAPHQLLLADSNYGFAQDVPTQHSTRRS